MKDIKEVRQGLETIGNRGLEYGDNNIRKTFKEEYNLLDQFIIDTELLMNDLNDAKTIIADYKYENEELKKENKKLEKSYHCAICNYDEEQYCEKCKYSKTLEQDQAIEPSVLEKYDALLKENNELKERLKKYE